MLERTVGELNQEVEEKEGVAERLREEVLELKNESAEY